MPAKRWAIMATFSLAKPHMPAALVWFRRDPHSVDHAALHHALRVVGRVHCAGVFDTARRAVAVRGWGAEGTCKERT